MLPLKKLAVCVHACAGGELREGRRERETGSSAKNKKISLRAVTGPCSLPKCILIGGTLMSRAIHLPSLCNERSSGQAYGQTWGVGGSEAIQRLHVALSHYAAVRRRAAWRQRG